MNEEEHFQDIWNLTQMLLSTLRDSQESAKRAERLEKELEDTHYKLATLQDANIRIVQRHAKLLRLAEGWENSKTDDMDEEVVNRTHANQLKEALMEW
jgi:hypothetical protein